MRKLVVALLALAIPLTALGAETRLAAGPSLFPGKVERLDVASFQARSDAPERQGVRLPDGRVLEAAPRGARPLAIGRPITIRGQWFTPVMVQPWVATATVRTSVPPLTRDQWPQFPRKLAIITHSYYVSALSSLDAFVAAKQDAGWEVVVVTEETWNPAGLSGQDAADALRGWLQGNYESAGIGYVLLAGHPDPNYGLVPMKMVWPLRELCTETQDPIWCDLQNLPTDMYFSDLDGDWDQDGDGLYGEYPDDAGEGGMNMGPEVIVGRFPAHWDTTFMDAYFALAAMYQTATDLKGRNRVLLPGAMIGFRGLGGSPDNQDAGAMLDTLGNRLAELDSNLVYTRMFEQEGYLKSPLPTDYPLSLEHLQNAFLYGHGLTVWFGHGYPTYVERMIWTADGDADEICDYNEYGSKTMMDSFSTSPFMNSPVQTFTWQISCMNGYPELEYNMAAMMLISNAAGAIAPSRSAMGEYAPNFHWAPSPEFAASETLAYYWAEAMQSAMPVGEALAYTRATVPSDGWDQAYPPSPYYPSMMGLGFHSKLVYNLYGDPTLVWTYEPGAHDPDWPWPDPDDDTTDDDDDDDDGADDDSAQGGTDDDAAAHAGDDDDGCGC
jgi:hypothetical protein